jgi:hypothetical protein
MRPICGDAHPLVPDYFAELPRQPLVELGREGWIGRLDHPHLGPAPAAASPTTPADLTIVGFTGALGGHSRNRLFPRWVGDRNLTPDLRSVGVFPRCSLLSR